MAEDAARGALADYLGLKLVPSPILLPGNRRLEIDAFFEDSLQVVLAEIWAHHGKPRGAQYTKVMQDLLKLVLARDRMLTQHPGKLIRCYFVYMDAEALAFVDGRSWKGFAFQHFKVTPLLMKISPDIKNKVMEAQVIQDGWQHE
ncbi:MAG: hypothetical protein V1797_01195 [Pseudomonadota bacterium]